MSLAVLLIVAARASAQPVVSPPPREAYSAQEYHKLLEQIESLKKELAAKKPLLPSGCAIHARIEKRGEVSVAALKLTFTFRTTASNTSIALGAKRSFLVSAKLDGQSLPPLETADTGFSMTVEATGIHTAVLDVECPIAGRGTKPEIGFELGLPHAAITTLVFEPPEGVGRVALTTRTAEAGKSGDPRRVAGLDVKTLAPPAPMRDPYPLGPVESLELSWEPPSAAPASDAARTAELDAVTQVTETAIETTAKLKLRGASRSWLFVAPIDAAITVNRIAGESSEAPVVTKPVDTTKPVWKIDLPVGTVSADWNMTIVIRSPRAKPNEPTFRGPFHVGPLCPLDVAKLSGTIRVSAPANTRLTFKHGRDLKQDVPPAPPSDDETVGFFRLAAGPLGNLPLMTPLLTFEAAPLAGRLVIRPNYKFALTDAGWNLRAEIRVSPIRTSLDFVTLELPSDWRGVELSPPNLVEEPIELKTDGTRKLLKVMLAAEHRQPFELVLAASIPLPAGAKEAAIPLLRFPNATERDSLVSVTVPDGTELHGTGREWEGEQPAGWSVPLPASLGPDGKPPKNITTINGKFERGLARLELGWSAFRPPLTAEVRADLTIRESQVVVQQRVTLRSPDGLPRTIRFSGAPELPGLAPFDRIAPGIWLQGFAPDLKEAIVKFEYAIPLPPADIRTMPINLVLPTGTSRTDVVTRVWVSTTSGRIVSLKAGPWREIPPDPAAERESLPVLTLAASGGELPLTLDVGKAAGESAITIERSLLQATHGDDGIAFRARFLLRRWSADSLDVRLPAAFDGVVPEAYLDEPPKRVPAQIRIENGERILRLPLPEARPGRMIAVEIRYVLPGRGVDEISEYPAPQPDASFNGPLRWHIIGPGGSIPVLLGGERSEQRWHTRFGLITPAPAGADELEKWFLTGAADGTSTGGTESVVVRVDSPASIEIVHLPRAAFIIGCSVGVLLLGLVLSRFPGWLAGPTVAVLFGVIAIAAVLYPQPASQIAAAATPGLAVLVFVLAFHAATRWHHRQRVTFLPGFTRSAPAPSASGSKPSDRAPTANPTTGTLLPQPASTGS